MTTAPSPPSCAASLVWMLQRLGDRVAGVRGRHDRVPADVDADAAAEPAPVG